MGVKVEAGWLIVVFPKVLHVDGWRVRGCFVDNRHRVVVVVAVVGRSMINLSCNHSFPRGTAKAVLQHCNMRRCVSILYIPCTERLSVL